MSKEREREREEQQTDRQTYRNRQTTTENSNLILYEICFAFAMADGLIALCVWSMLLMPPAAQVVLPATL